MQVNIITLRKILSLIEDSKAPIAAHAISSQLNLNPNTVVYTVQRAERALGIVVSRDQRGFRGVDDWGVLKRDLFLEIPEEGFKRVG